MSFYSYTYEGPARKHFQWRSWAVRSRLRPIIEAAGMGHQRDAICFHRGGLDLAAAATK